MLTCVVMHRGACACIQTFVTTCSCTCVQIAKHTGEDQSSFAPSLYTTLYLTDFQTRWILPPPYPDHCYAWCSRYVCIMLTKACGIPLTRTSSGLHQDLTGPRLHTTVGQLSDTSQSTLFSKELANIFYVTLVLLGSTQISFFDNVFKHIFILLN